MNDDTEPLDTNEAFRPGSPWWGAMVVPVAVVVEDEEVDE